MKNWSQEIFACFDHFVTNTYTEALNGLIQLTNRLGRGYSFEMIRAKMLYDDGLVGERSFSYRNAFLSIIMPLDPKEHIPAAPDGTYLSLIGNDLSTLEERIRQGRF
jgi:transposase